MSNTFSKIQIWNTQQPGFKYPETDKSSTFRYEPILNRPNSGICVSGGGSVSASLIAGYYAALQDLKLMNSLRYISGVSGGAWGSAPFVYKANNYKNFSGTVKMPGDIREDKINKDISTTVSGSMQNAVTKADIAAKCTDFYVLSTDKNRNQVYEKAVGSLFLVSFSINSPVLDATKRQFFSSASKVVTDIKSRNPGLKDIGFMTVADDMPFLIMNTTMMVPLLKDDNKKGNLDDAFYICPFEVTPLYCGIKSPQTTGNGRNIGGYFIESYGFNTQLSQAAKPTDTTVAATGDFPFELCQPVGASGSALEEMLINDHTNWVDCFPQFNYWHPLHPEEQDVYDFGDGGCIEDTGITPLLARGVQNIAAFLTEAVFFPSTVIPDSTDTIGMSNFSERAFGYNQIASLFGLQTIDAAASAKTVDNVTDNPGYIVWKDALPAKKVFDNSNNQFGTLLTTLYNARTTGTAMVASMSMNVVPCSLYGITATTRYTPQVIWSVVDNASQWTDALSSDAKTYFQNNTDELKDFPVVKVFGQNLDKLIQLTPAQTNLLADFAYWMVKSNSDTYSSILTSTKVPVEAELA